jgi:hypothetical protein
MVFSGVSEEFDSGVTSISSGVFTAFAEILMPFPNPRRFQATSLRRKR